MNVTPPSVRAGTLSEKLRMGGGARRLILMAVVALSLGGCATKRDIRDLGENLQVLNAQQADLIRELRREQARLQDSVQVLSVAQLEMRAIFLRRMVDLQEDLLRLQEVTGISQQQLAAIRDQMDRARSSIPSGGFVFDESGGGGGGGAAEEIYNEALTAHGRGSFGAARLGFQEVVERFPGHTLAPEARYFLADIMEQEGESAEALAAFLRIAELHPAAPRVPEALYRAGLIHRSRGEQAEARRLFERVVNTWPNSPAAQLARAYLGGELR
jgi:tol-pal system protein YbgF